MNSPAGVPVASPRTVTRLPETSTSLISHLRSGMALWRPAIAAITCSRALASALVSNLKARLVVDAERHGPRYEAHLRCLVMKRTRGLLVRARRKLHVRPQGHAFELTGTVGLLNHDSGGVVAIFLDDDSCLRTKV